MIRVLRCLKISIVAGVAFGRGILRRALVASGAVVSNAGVCSRERVCAMLKCRRFPPRVGRVARGTVGRDSRRYVVRCLGVLVVGCVASLAVGRSTCVLASGMAGRASYSFMCTSQGINTIVGFKLCGSPPRLGSMTRSTIS